MKTAECRADRVVREELKRRRWSEEDLTLATGDLVKGKLAARLREKGQP